MFTYNSNDSRYQVSNWNEMLLILEKYLIIIKKNNYNFY